MFLLVYYPPVKNLDNFHLIFLMSDIFHQVKNDVSDFILGLNGPLMQIQFFMEDKGFNMETLRKIRTYIVLTSIFIYKLPNK